MVYRGHVHNGSIVLDDNVPLPEGASVDVMVREDATNRTAGGPTLYESLKEFIGVVDDLPPDASINVDHYLYGHPKQ